MQSKYTAKDIVRFWGKVNKEISQTFYNGTRCWIWTGSLSGAGYGAINILGKGTKTHRISYELAFGEIQEGLHILHRCDNPPCCNPNHLFAGTHQENMIDRGKKGRTALHKGEDNGRCKLSDSQVYEIRQRYGFYGKGGESLTMLAKAFGVTYGHIHKIVKYKNRK